MQTSYLPYEILIEIVKHSRGDRESLKALSQVSSLFRGPAQRLLFETLDLSKSFDKVEDKLAHITSHPSLMKHVRNLVLQNGALVTEAAFTEFERDRDVIPLDAAVFRSKATLVQYLETLIAGASISSVLLDLGIDGVPSYYGISHTCDVSDVFKALTVPTLRSLTLRNVNHHDLGAFLPVPTFGYEHRLSRISELNIDLHASRILAGSDLQGNSILDYVVKHLPRLTSLGISFVEGGSWTGGPVDFSILRHVPLRRLSLSFMFVSHIDVLIDESRDTLEQLLLTDVNVENSWSSTFLAAEQARLTKLHLGGLWTKASGSCERGEALRSTNAEDFIAVRRLVAQVLARGGVVTQGTVIGSRRSARQH